MSRIEAVTTPRELEALFEASSDRPVLLFKHSLTCGVSSEALRQLERWASGLAEPDAPRVALIEIQRVRSLSDEVARRTGVRHQSPQAILLRDGEAVWDASHWSISEATLRAATA